MAGETNPELVKQTLALYAEQGIITRVIDLTPKLRRP